MRYAWISGHASEYPVTRMVKALKVSRGGYYAWTKREPGAREKRREKIVRTVKVFHDRSRRVYGYRKIHKDICSEAPEVRCSAETVRKVMRAEGLRSRVKKKFVATTNSAHDRPVARNIVSRDFSADGPDKKWSADITYIPTREGWLYLAVVLDLWSRKVVGWSMKSSIRFGACQKRLERSVA